ncbi:MAG: hypothetical protein ACI9EF_002612, partial [Pseudohongiellaceae bacterium]
MAGVRRQERATIPRSLPPRKNPMLHRLPLVALVTVVLGCAAPVVPGEWLAHPAVGTAVDHFEGNPFSGPALLRAGSGAAEIESALAVRGQAYFVRGDVVQAWQPLEAATKLIADPLAAQPILVEGKLLADVRLLTYDGALPQVDDSESALRLSSLPGVLDLGLTCELAVTDPGQPGRPEVLSLQLHRPRDGGELLAILTARREDPAGQLLDWEQAVLSFKPALGGPHLAVAIPSNDGRGYYVISAVIEKPPADPEGFLRYAEQLATARQQAGLRHEGLLALVDRYRGSAAQPTDLLAALSGLATTNDQRGMVLYLASGTGAALAFDLALVGNGPILAQICEDTQQAMDEGSSLSPQSLAWVLDSSGWRALAAEASREESDLGLTAVLLRHGGEVGRNPTLLLELLDGSADTLSFDNALLAENLSYLEVNVPAARVRAYDWL